MVFSISRLLPFAALLLVLCQAGPIRIWGQEPPSQETAGSAVDPTGEPEESTPAVRRAVRVGADEDAEAGILPAASDGEAEASRGQLNLLGQVQSEAGESKRNENVQIDLIDNNVLKDLNTRVGVTATIVEEFEPARRYFGSDFGNAPSSPVHAAGATLLRAVHGNVYWFHQNSVFSARSFFQVGGVQPARDNNYGFQVGSPLWKGANLSVDGSQTRSRGNVNGNVLVPTPEERTPLTRDPVTRPLVQRMLDLYPRALPNRTDISPRMLNTNAPQSIDNDIGGIGLDQAIGSRDRLVGRYRHTAQRVDAFQLVTGQNPDTRTKAHDSRLTWTRVLSATTALEATTAFDRVQSELVPARGAFPVTVLTSDVIQGLGPGSNIPITRSVNQFRNGFRVRQSRGRHNWTFGAEILRRQVNGFEADTHRGQFSFRGDYGRDAITNILMGTPSSFIQSIGNVHRGFRNWDSQFYIGDRWQAAQNLTLNLGLRYEPISSPYEVNGLNEVPYPCDCNNFAPQFGFAWHMGDGLGVLRGAYGLQYSEVFPATFGQVRQNAPLNIRTRVDAPNFVNPLAGIDLSNILETRSTLYEISPDLVMPYVHMYNLSWQAPLPGNWRLEMGYLGSRAFKLLSEWYANRGQPVDGIPQVTGTVALRRPDARYHDIRRVLGGSTGYYDAAKMSLLMPRWHGLTMDVSYWFSKAIDLGANYLSTASGKDAREGRGQYEFDVHRDMKALSSFHQPHALVWKGTYQTPRISPTSWWGRTIGRWELSSVVLLKSGTPFSVNTGSDGPGFGNVDGSGSDRPHLLDPSVLGRSIDHPDTAPQLLPFSAFGFLAPTDTRGNIGRNTFRKDSIQNINGAISRSWPLGGERSVTFRAESINLGNHPQFAEPGTELANSNFGQITNTLNDGRSFRFLLRLGF